MKVERIWQADVQQRVFRELLEAFSRPGDMRDLSTWVDGTTAQRAVLATLMDGEMTLADPHGRIMDTDWPLLQAKPGASEHARYVAVDGHRAPDFQPELGSLESPEFGATLLIGVNSLGDGELSLELVGPGIDGQRNIRLAGLHPDWLTRRADWVGSFPLGVDLLLSDAHRIVALPRTTRIRISGGAL
ncbi:MAG: phosphonate C-P lyase system protein PhnH [Betaproteobacteria bacterium HGW-Betaproteobacteria-11]|nr:MAG: phosphonate C-P lyase system protein PhnH [Betaproteobacteria bacterium HGW-Betaproteobacteria-11]